MHKATIDLKVKLSIAQKIGIAVITIGGFALAVGLILGAIQKEPVTKGPPSETISVTYEFAVPRAEKAGDYDRITVSGLNNYAKPGEPVLPYKTANILIPQGKEVASLEIVPGDSDNLPGQYSIGPGQVPLPTTVLEGFTYKPTPSDAAIYGSSKAFPLVSYFGDSTQNFRGYNILTVSLVPIQYFPKQGEVNYFTKLTAKVTLQENVGEPVHPLFRGLAGDAEAVSRRVDNTGVIETYDIIAQQEKNSVWPFQVAKASKIAARISDIPGPAPKYVIITNQALESSWQPFVNWKIQEGMSRPTVVTTQDIYDNYSGADYQEKIRNFIIDVYTNWQIEYVLLGGDVEVVPTREVTCTHFGFSRQIPTDFYYAELGGDWQADDDMCRIDYNGVDFMAELLVGRAPVNTTQEVNNFINKTIAYNGNTIQSYKTLLVGQYLGLGDQGYGIQWGGGRKDEVSSLHPFEYQPLTKLYERDESYTKVELINELNSDFYQVVNHSDHGSSLDYHEVSQWGADITYFPGLESGDVDDLTNEDYLLAYSTGCWTAAFNESDAIGEHFIFDEHGAYAYIGNSHFGWWYRNFPDQKSSSAIADEEFFKSIFYAGERELGWAFQIAKEKLSTYDKWHRWTYFALNLFGDPEIEVISSQYAIGKIIAPFSGDCIDGQIDIVGTVTGDTLEDYTLMYSLADPIEWHEIGTYTTPIVNNTIAQWDTREIDDGDYLLKLTVNDVFGNDFVDQIEINVNNSPFCPIPDME